MQRTPAYKLIETRLGEPLEDFVLRLRADDRSWPYIARKLGQTTDHWVTGECVRKWFGDADLERLEAGSAA